MMLSNDSGLCTYNLLNIFIEAVGSPKKFSINQCEENPYQKGEVLRS